MGRARISILFGAFLAAVVLPTASPLAAGETPPADVDVQGDRRTSDARAGYDERAYGILFARRRPWTFAKWLPADLSTDLGSSGDGIVRGVSFEPEWTIDAVLRQGPVQLLAEAGIYAAVTLDDPAPGTSGWWLMLELAGGDPATALAPYITYEPLTLHDGLFGAHLATFHTVTLGARRAIGPTAVDLFIRRREGGAGPARNTVAMHLNHRVPLGETVSLAIRGDVELRPFDRDPEGRRTDVRARVRTRVTVALDPAVDLVLTADLQRNWSNRPDRAYTQFVLGPALSARLRF